MHNFKLSSNNFTNLIYMGGIYWYPQMILKIPPKNHPQKKLQKYPPDNLIDPQINFFYPQINLFAPIKTSCTPK